jgi:hypothetical protein
MAKEYLVTCANRSISGCHVVEVGAIRVGRRKPKVLRVREVRDKIAGGDRFFTRDAEGNEADAANYFCSKCNSGTIRTQEDSSIADNLDALPGR